MVGWILCPLTLKDLYDLIWLADGQIENVDIWSSQHPRGVASSISLFYFGIAREFLYERVVLTVDKIIPANFLFW